jgi:hypothetical protein
MMIPTTATPVRFDPAGLYDDDALYASLELSAATMARARREGRLRYTRQGRRVLYLGQWLLDWLTADSALAAGKGLADGSR